MEGFEEVEPSVVNLVMEVLLPWMDGCFILPESCPIAMQ